MFGRRKAPEERWRARFLRAFPRDQSHKIEALIPQSKAQLHQDLFALWASDFKPNGFFVEFGATNGIHLSNTYLLETEFGWSGILAEPGASWQTALSDNRNATIDPRCVWRVSGEVMEFVEAEEPELSTLAQSLTEDGHQDSRASGYRRQVETVSLIDLLRSHRAPKQIDFMSVDTEGSEFEILRAFDFDAYDIRAICVEHNYGATRKPILQLLGQNGYRRVFKKVSRFDDWYIRTK